MIAAAFAALFLGCGILTIRFLLPGHRVLNRIWLGLSLGVLEAMWLPALAAFVFGFGEAAHELAAAAVILLTLGCYALRDKRPVRAWDAEETALGKQLLWIALPLTVLGVYLQITHTMRPDAAGNWHVGQSTYGDLPMHMSFVTGLAGKTFPADYPFYPGARLSYPFLTDSLSTSFYLMGCSLQASMILPGSLMMALCYAGVLILGREMTPGKRAAALAALLFFLNGGLGFLYDFDLAGGRLSTDAGAPLPEQAGQVLRGWFETAAERIRSILTGYYKTPTNQPNPNNLRWSNVICDLMVPQRTLLGGWCMVLPCYYLLETLFRPKKVERGDNLRGIVLLGIWAGALPLIHTHSFLALALSSVGVLVYDWIHGDPYALLARRSRWVIVGRYVIYGFIAAVLALPQLIGFTFGQALGGEGTHSFLQFQFNWVNNPGGQGMRDLYLWFYLKNIGLPFAMVLLALIEKKPRRRRLFALALPVILAAEFIRFQPNEYDNNKLLYLAWLPCCMIAADWCGDLWRRLKGLRARPVIAALGAVVLFLSAGLTIWRECVSDYVGFGAQAVEAGEYVRDHTEKDAVFITGTEHLNPVCAIAGRQVVCGPDLWLYWHGFETGERQEELRLFYENPEAFPEVPQKYGAGYIFVSSYERTSYDVDEEALRENYPVVFENGEATIYRIPEG